MTATTTQIAKHLNVAQSAIVRIEEWANVLFCAVKGLGGRFVSKKIGRSGTKMSFDITKVGRKIQVTTKYGDAIIPQLKSQNFKWNPQDKVWEKGYTKDLWLWLEGIKSKKEEFASTLTANKAAGLTLNHKHSYDCRDEIKQLGGVWDKFQKVWVMPSEENLKKAIDCCNRFAVKEVKKDTLESILIPEYRSRSYQVGQFFKLQDNWCRVVRTKESFDDDGTKVFYRLATETEIVEIESSLSTKKAKERIEEICSSVVATETAPETAEINAPTLQTITPRLSLALTDDEVWVLVYNGADGDDWRGNNYSDKFIAYKAPHNLAVELRQLLKTI